MELSEKDVDVIMEAVENPPAPNEALITAAEKHKDIIDNTHTFYNEPVIRRYNDSVASAENNK